MAFKGQIIIDTERCKGCGVCVPVCPMKCIALSKNVNGKPSMKVALAAHRAPWCARTALSPFTRKKSKLVNRDE